MRLPKLTCFHSLVLAFCVAVSSPVAINAQNETSLARQTVEALKVTEPNGTFHSKVIHVNASGTYPTIASAITALAGGSGHIIIDDGYSAVVPSFTLGVIPCQNANTPWAQILEMGANVSLYTTGSIKLECGGYVYGDNRDGAVITPCTGTNTPVAGCSAFTYASGIAYAIDMGDFVNNSALIDARVEGVTININLPNSVGIRGRGLNENSYIARNAIENDTNVGILIDGSTIVTANFKIDDNQILDNNASTAYGIELINAGTVRMTRNTVSSNTLIQSTGACFYITGSNAGYFSGNDLADGHCEKHNDGVLVDGNPGLNIFSLDVNGGAGGSNALRIASTANTNVTGYWMRNNTPSNNVVLNQVARCPLTLSANNPPAPGGVITDYHFTIGATACSNSWYDALGWHGFNIPIVASLTTTSGTSDNVILTGMTSSGHCLALTPTNASAATNIATSYISAKAANQITVTHTATAGMTYDVSCTPN